MQLRRPMHNIQTPAALPFPFYQVQRTIYEEDISKKDDQQNPTNAAQKEQSKKFSREENQET